MKKTKHFHHIASHVYSGYAVSPKQHFYSFVIAPALTVLILIIVFFVFSSSPVMPERSFSLGDIVTGTTFTILRLFLSYTIALSLAIPLALLVVRNPMTEKVLFPLLDVLQSIPVLAFFPIIILFFVRFNFFEGAAIFLLSTSMLWEIVFTLIGGLKVIPSDIKAAASVFGVRGFTYVRRVLLPSIVPHIITGSLLAWAEGWNIIIVVEVLHNYIKNGTSEDDLFGVGSILTQASVSGRKDVMIAALVVMVIAIAFMNFFVWQKLLHHAEKYKYD